MERTNGATREGHLEALAERARAGLPLFGPEGPAQPPEDSRADDSPPQAVAPTARHRQPSGANPPGAKSRAGAVVCAPAADRWREVAHRVLDLVAEGGFEGRGPAGPTCLPPVAATNEEWRWLSPLEEQILAMVTGQYRTAPELAAALKLTCSSDFRMVLRNLVSRQILDSSGEGYRLRLP